MNAKTRCVTLFILLLFPVLLPAQQDKAKEAAAKIRTMYFARDFEGAYFEGRKLLELYPESPGLRAWIVANSAKYGKSKEAVAMAGEMLAADSTSAWSWFALAAALSYYDEENRDEEAIVAGEKALDLAPRQFDMILLQAMTLARAQKLEAAIDHIDKYLDVVDNKAELLAAKGNVMMASILNSYNEAKAQEAAQIFAEAQKLDSRNVNALYLPGHYFARQRQYALALPLLEKARTLSPLSKDIHSRYWEAVNGLPDKSTAEKQAEILADMDDFLKARREYPQTVFAAYNFCKRNNLHEKAAQLSEQILRKFPDSEAAEWILVENYRDFEKEHGEEGFEDTAKRDEYRKMLLQFIDRPHHHRESLKGDAYRNLFYTMKDDSTVHAYELLKVVQGMVEYEKINLHISYAMGAIALAERKAHLDQAIKIAKDGIPAAKEKLEKERSWLEKMGRFDESLNYQMGTMHDALGWVYFLADRYDEAEKALLQSYQFYPQSRDNLYHLGSLYETRNDPDKAEEFYIKGMAVRMPGENPNAKALETLYEKRNGSLTGLEEYMAKLGEIDRQRRKEKILSARIENPKGARPFNLKTLDGSSLSLQDLKGRVAAVNFWGIWCYWCVKEMPDLQKLSEMYADKSDVLILTINNDQNPDDVPPWMEKHHYTFPVLFDDGYGNKANIHTFPTTWFLDQSGKIVFIKEGWSEKLLEEFTWRIEAMRKSNPVARQ